MVSGSVIARCARNAGIVAALLTIGAVIAGVLPSLLKGEFHPASSFWRAGGAVVILVFSAAFIPFFVWNLISAVRAQPVYDILEEEAPESELLAEPLQGFVAMEYYWGILNRTFVVFIAPERLYGWKALGPVTNANRTFYEPLLEMLGDAELARDRAAIEKLARLRGGFSYQRSSIVSVVADDHQKWGMGGIPHTGRIHLRLGTGRSREFILLGNQMPEDVRDRIVRVMRIGVTSVL